MTSNPACKEVINPGGGGSRPSLDVSMVIDSTTGVWSASLGSAVRGRYNPHMLPDRQLPDANRLSVLVATILLAYALTRVIALPPYNLEASLLGRDLKFQLDASALAPFLTAGLMATGMDWLLRNHPGLTSQGRAEHLVLPALTAWVAGIFIYSLADSSGWWVAFGLS